MANGESRPRVVPRTASADAERGGRGPLAAAFAAGFALSRGFLDAAMDAVIGMNEDGTVVEFSASAERLFGYKRADAIGRELAELIVPPELREAHRRGLERFRRGGESPVLGRRLEFPALRADGSRFEAELTVVRIAHSQPALFAGMVRDVTERRAAEARLRESEARFRALTELSSDWYWEQDASYRFTRVEGSRVAGSDEGLRARITGLTRWESGMGIEGGWEAHRKLLDARQSFRNVLMWRTMADGETRQLSVSGQPVFAADGRFTGYRGVGRDITERLQAEARLRESETRFRALTAISADWYWEQDENFRFVSQLGWEARPEPLRPPRYIGLTRWEAHEQSLSPEQWAAHRAQVEAHQSFRNLEFQRMSNDGQMRWVSVSGHPIFDESGAFRGYRGVGQDITERKRLEAERTKALERVQLALETSRVTFWDRDMLSGEVYLSEQWAELVGAEPGETSASIDQLLALVHPEDADQLRRVSLPAIKGEREAYYAEHRVYTRSGEWRWVLSHGRVTERDAQGRALRMIGTNLDITERKRGERLRALELAVAQTLAISREPNDALQGVMRAICGTEDWDCACYFRIDEQAGMLCPGVAWGIGDPLVERHLDAQRSCSQAPGSGLVGKAWRSREPIWCADIQQDDQAALPQPAGDGAMRATVAIPIAPEEGGFGVLILQCRRARPHDAALLGALSVIGGHIGLYLQRSQAESELRRREQELRLVTDNVPSPITHLDREQRFVFVNRAYADMMERPIASIIGRRLQEVVSPEVYTLAKPYIDRVLAGEQVRFTRSQQRSDGSERVLQVTYHPDSDESGRVIGWFGMHNDVTEQSVARERVERANVELEQRVAERTAELRTTVRELDAFTYTVSHDLRSPLGAIGGFTDLLRGSDGERLSEAGRESLQHIETNTARMAAMVEGLLEFARLGKREPRCLKVSMNALVSSVIAETTVGRHVELRVGELPPCSGDPVLLTQVWSNLIGNALKYSRGRVPAIVEIGYDVSKSAYFVHDNGIGFDMRYADKLFQVFERLHNDAEIEGTGVGLAIVRQIIERHGGRIWAESARGQGATFHFIVGVPQSC